MLGKGWGYGSCMTLNDERRELTAAWKVLINSFQLRMFLLVTHCCALMLRYVFCRALPELPHLIPLSQAAVFFMCM